MSGDDRNSKEAIRLNGIGQKMTTVVDRNHKKKRKWETILLVVVIFVQLVCTVCGFIGFALYVDNKFEDYERKLQNASRQYYTKMKEQIEQKQFEQEQKSMEEALQQFYTKMNENTNNETSDYSKKTIDEALRQYYAKVNEHINRLEAEIEILKRNNTSKQQPLQKLPIHGSDTEKFTRQAYTVESIDQYYEIENVNGEILDDESDEYDTEPAEHNLNVSQQKQSPVDNSHNGTSNDEPNLEELHQKIMEQQSQANAMHRNTSNMNRPTSLQLILKNSKINLLKNKDKPEAENNDKRKKRNANPGQDKTQSLMNSISSTPFINDIDNMKISNSKKPWPAVHFDSQNPSIESVSKDSNDCPREVKYHTRKWRPTVMSGSEHFDLKNDEYITIKKSGLYFIYSQIFFYQDRSMFGYSIENNKETVLQCSIHSPVNRTKSGSGTSCFTGGLVYLNQDDVLRLELHNDSGRCVKWGPTKSFIGLFKLPTDLN